MDAGGNSVLVGKWYDMRIPKINLQHKIQFMDAVALYGRGHGVVGKWTTAEVRKKAVPCNERAFV